MSVGVDSVPTGVPEVVDEEDVVSCDQFAFQRAIRP